MESTSITLLALDGQFTVTFSPRLTAAQYADLESVVSKEFLSQQQFCERFAEFAKTWGVKFSSDGTCDE